MPTSQNLPVDMMQEKDRDELALYIQDIELDHRLGRDGNLMEDVRVYFGKKGTANYQQIYWASRLERENPLLHERYGAAIEKWKKDQVLPIEGTPLESWPAITKGQIKACKGIGLRTIEDIATSSDSIREKIGLGAADLINKAKAFLANKEGSAQANRISVLEEQVKTLMAELETARETNDALAAKAGKRVQKPRMEQEAA